MAEAGIQYAGDTPREQRGDPGDNTLRKRIIEHEKRASPRELRRMTEDGTLEEYLATKIRARHPALCPGPDRQQRNPYPRLAPGPTGIHL